MESLLSFAGGKIAGLSSVLRAYEGIRLESFTVGQSSESIQCSACGKSFRESELILTEKGHLCELCELELSSGQDVSSTEQVTLIASALSLIPFFFHYRIASLTNLHRPTYSSLSQVELFGHWPLPRAWPGGIFDIVGVLFGGATLLACALAAIRIRRSVRRRKLWWAFTGVVAMVGIWQILYGFGLVP